MRQQTEKLKPLLEARVAELRGQVNAAESSGEDSDKDTANSMNMVYTMGKDNPKVAKDGMIAGTLKIDPQAVGNIMQPLSATMSGSEPQPEANQISVTVPLQRTQEPHAGDTGSSTLDLGMGPITQEKADEVRAQELGVMDTGTAGTNNLNLIEAYKEHQKQEEKDAVNMADVETAAKQGFAEAPTELKQMYNILGIGDTGTGISFDNLEKSFGKDMHFEMDNEGNVIGDYRDALRQRIEEQCPESYQDKQELLLEGTLLLLKAEFGKQNADPAKIIDVTDKYGQMVAESLDNPFWQTEMLGLAGNKGIYYLKDNPKAIQDLCGDQIPQEIMNEALKVGGANGVNYLMQQGYGYFRVGDKVLSPEELGNYSLGVIATGHGHARKDGYGAANVDRLKMGGDDYGELYDKYYQTMGMNDVKRWQ